MGYILSLPAGAIEAICKGTSAARDFTNSGFTNASKTEVDIHDEDGFPTGSVWMYDHSPSRFHPFDFSI